MMLIDGKIHYVISEPVVKYLITQDSISKVQQADIENLELQVAEKTFEVNELNGKINLLEKIDSTQTESLDIVDEMLGMTKKELRKYKADQFFKKVGKWFKDAYDKILYTLGGAAVGAAATLVGIYAVP